MSLRKTKTDKKDSFIIALFALKNPEILSKHNKQMSTIKRLCRERDKLSEDIAKIKTEIKSDLIILFPELEKKVNVFTKTMLLLLEKYSASNSIANLRTSQIDAILNKTQGNKMKISAKELKILAKNSIGFGDRYLEKVLNLKIIRLRLFQSQSNDFEILTSIKGIGEITAQKFLLEIDDIRNFNNHKQLTAYIGTDPSIR